MSMRHGGSEAKKMRLQRALLVMAGVGVLAVAPGASASADARAHTGTFTFTDSFIVQPGDPASCSFPITVDQVGRAAFQILFDADGTPIRGSVHTVWQGTLAANGKTVTEHAAQNDTFNLIDGTSTNIGSIHDQAFGQGVVIHDVGILRFNADGSLAFEAGQHQGFDGDPAAIASLCAALS